MKRMKNWKLVTKLAVIISIMLVFIFATQIGVTVFLTQSVINLAISNELSVMAQNNGTQVQKVFEAATTISSDMQNYLSDTYKNAETIAVEGAVNSFTSKVYHVPLKQLPYLVENYILGTARTAATTNEYVSGVGAMFEPQKFAANLDSYSVYIDEDIGDAKVTPHSEYSEYSKEDYYRLAVDQKKTIVTKPYTFEDKMLVSVSTPVIYNDVVQGVVLADINVSNFSKIKMDTSKYSSLYGIVFDDEGTLIYHTTAPDTVGHTLADSGGQANADVVMAQIPMGVPFNAAMTMPDGSKVSIFCSPISVAGETWWSMTALNDSEMTAAVRSTTMWLLGIAVAAFLILVVVVIITLRKLLNPLKAVVGAAQSHCRRQL